MSLQVEESSFRDRDGFVFFEHGNVYRAVHPHYIPTWRKLQASGLLQNLVKDGRLCAFEEESAMSAQRSDGCLVLKVEKVPFISYPGEWTFRQLRLAALLTLDIQLQALSHGFVLKDASAFNVQFKGPRPVFIDLLSFEPYEEGSPWVAYRQFCSHFLAGLLLLYYRVPGVTSLFVSHIDGLPLHLASRLLPFRSRFSLLAATHIHMHARFEKKHAASAKPLPAGLRLSKKRLVDMLSHLREGIRSLKVQEEQTNWTGYYGELSYSKEGFQAKKNFIQNVLERCAPVLCLDLGCNTGEFSMQASQCCDYVVACDSDERVVSLLQRKKPANVLPLCIDLSNPTPAYGWNNQERQSFLGRAENADLVLALALVHHLCIGNNVPLAGLAQFFFRFRHLLVIEFVPRNDVQVSKLLVTKKDVFEDYTLENFITAFTRYFSILDRQATPGSERQLFLMKRKTE